MGNGDNKFRIAVFEGDGIGPEITRPTLELLDMVARQSGEFDLSFELLPAGAGHYQENGTALPEESMKRARDADAILLSAIGLPDVRYVDGTEIRPQVDLRMNLDLYAGVRPVRFFPGGGCPLSDPRASKIDFVLVRESTEGLFAHMHEGQVIDNHAAVETLRITRPTSEKLFDFAFDLARQRGVKAGRRARVTCVDKANIFRSFWFFRSIFEERASRYPDVDADAAYVDAMAMWMVQKPWELDVLVTENMFGDILSDLGAGIMGSLGLAPSADIGDEHAVFQALPRQRPGYRRTGNRKSGRHGAVGFDDAQLAGAQARLQRNAAGRGQDRRCRRRNAAGAGWPDTRSWRDGFDTAMRRRGPAAPGVSRAASLQRARISSP